MDPAAEDMRALAQVRAAMLLSGQDPKSIPGWKHGGEAIGVGAACGAPSDATMREQNEGLLRENARLSGIVAELQGRLAEMEAMVGRMMAAQADGHAEDPVAGIVGGLPADGSAGSVLESNPWATEGDGQYCQVECASIADPHGKTNVLCCALHPREASGWVASGGVDKRVCLHDWRAHTPEARGASSSSGGGGAGGAVVSGTALLCTAPPLVLEWRPQSASEGSDGLLVVGCMDGSLYLARPSLGSVTGSPSGPVGLEPVAVSDDCGFRHGKHVHAARWASDGTLLATCSADATAKLWRVEAATAGAEATVTCVKTWHLQSAAEALCFLGGCLVLAPRGHHALTYVDLLTLQSTDVSLNDAAWDKVHTPPVCCERAPLVAPTTSSPLAITCVPAAGLRQHVSFNVLHLSPSPDQRFLLAATDKDRHIVYRAGHHKHERLLVGHSADGFAKPRAAWDASGKVRADTGALLVAAPHLFLLPRLTSAALPLLPLLALPC